MRKHLSAILYIAILLVIAFLVFYLSCVPDVMTTSRGADSQNVEAVLGRPFYAMDVPAGTSLASKGRPSTASPFRESEPRDVVITSGTHDR